MVNIKIEYDGEYPNLCSGTLRVTLGRSKKVWTGFELSSGGSVWFDDDWGEHVDSGEWDIIEWPERFPEKYKTAVLEAVNSQIDHGCCGGCV